MKHPMEDPLLFGIDIIDKLVAEYMQLEAGSAEFSNFTEDINVIGCLGFVTNAYKYDELLEVQDLSDSEDDIADLANLDHNSEFVDLIDQVCKYDEESECSERARVQVVETEKSLPAQQPSGCRVRFGQSEPKATEGRDRLDNQVPNPDRVGQLKPRSVNDISPLHSPPVELKPLPGHLKYAYLGNDQ
ncbi:hypothetical protein CR513_18154, partial [Mucuna pruriens]